MLEKCQGLVAWPGSPVVCKACTCIKSSPIDSEHHSTYSSIAYCSRQQFFKLSCPGTSLSLPATWNPLSRKAGERSWETVCMHAAALPPRHTGKLVFPNHITFKIGPWTHPSRVNPSQHATSQLWFPLADHYTNTLLLLFYKLLSCLGCDRKAA